MNPLQNTRWGPSVMDILGFRQDTPIPELHKTLTEMAPVALAALQAKARDLECSKEILTSLRNTGRALQDSIKLDTAELAALTAASVKECVDLGSACDVTSLAQQLRTHQDALALKNRAYSWLIEVGLQDAQERVHDGELQVRSAETVGFTIALLLSEINNQRALEGVCATEGKIIFFSEKTETMRAQVGLAERSEAQAREALEEFRTRRARIEKQKKDAGIPSRF